ncbi:universal stress protein [Natranaerobius thermophilus]|uniref:UspA domain protein n=1 Tax=Natranaerobius thermophilus (strain ATCC BAA-1301 / DSM 18059 / JW/NM-WN-LF) TaxID=457570 RepID=B2A6S3_NATTJ|nr:universal stress protein [Natranaerobius thermophilus]ACB84204.1 UspA domain protein [Natranaerobius thermophilus JW/NM-WN-LF]
MFKKALMPLTLREQQDEFLSSVSLLAKLSTNTVHLCHVIDSGFTKYSLVSNKIKLYKNILADKFPSLNVSSEILSGHAGSKIIESAKTSESEFIYLPASQRHRLGQLLIGSTASDVVRLSDRPVFVHKSQPIIKFEESNSEIEKENNDHNKGLFGQVIVAIDFGPNTDRTSYSLTELGNLASTVTYLHIGKRAGDPFSESKRREHVQQQLEELKKDYQCYCHDINTRDRIGIPSKEILKEAKQTQADLIILGKLKVKSPGEIIMGTTAERVLKGTQSSVLIIP